MSEEPTTPAEETQETAEQDEVAEPVVEAAPVALPELNASPQVGDPSALGLLLDVGVEVAVVVGRRQLTLEQLLATKQGSVIDLEQLAGDPVQIEVNGKPYAKGEVVVVQEQIGVRITELLSLPAED